MAALAAQLGCRPYSSDLLNTLDAAVLGVLYVIPKPAVFLTSIECLPLALALFVLHRRTQALSSLYSSLGTTTGAESPALIVAVTAVLLGLLFSRVAWRRRGGTGAGALGGGTLARPC